METILAFEGTNWFRYDVLSNGSMVGSLGVFYDGWRWNYSVCRASDGRTFSARRRETALAFLEGKV